MYSCYPKPTAEIGRNRKFGSFLDKSGKNGQKWTKLPKTTQNIPKWDKSGKNRKKQEKRVN
jgi:hypothetical protein